MYSRGAMNMAWIGIASPSSVYRMGRTIFLEILIDDGIIAQSRSMGKRYRICSLSTEIGTEKFFRYET